MRVKTYNLWRSDLILQATKDSGLKQSANLRAANVRLRAVDWLSLDNLQFASKQTRARLSQTDDFYGRERQAPENLNEKALEILLRRDASNVWSGCLLASALASYIGGQPYTCCSCGIARPSHAYHYRQLFARHRYSGIEKTTPEQCHLNERKGGGDFRKCGCRLDRQKRDHHHWR